MTPVERVRTSSRMFQRLLDYARACADSGADAWSAQHINAPDQCAELVERCTEIYGHGPTIVSEIGPVLSAHTGPGLLGTGAVPSRFVSSGYRRSAGRGEYGPDAERAEHRPHRAHGRRRGDLAVPAVALRKPIGWLLIATFLAVALRRR